jgi:hypothetical protein
MPAHFELSNKKLIPTGGSPIVTEKKTHGTAFKVMGQTCKWMQSSGASANIRINMDSGDLHVDQLARSSHPLVQVLS